MIKKIQVQKSIESKQYALRTGLIDGSDSVPMVV